MIYRRKSQLSAQLSGIASFLALIVFTFAGGPALWGQTYPTQVGVEVLDRQTGFMDALKDQGRLFLTTDQSATAPTDANGWPTTDGVLVVFDNRPVPAWTGTIDDPAQNQPNCSGWYTMSFNGQATLSSVSNAPTLTFANQTYNSETNTTTVSVYMPGGPTYADGQAVMEISFTNTIRSYGGSTNTGVTNVQVIRPGFTLAEADSTQPFDPVFLNSLAPFAYLRVMDWLGTNTNPFYGTGATPTIGWSDRSLPTDEFQGLGVSIRHGAWGVSWEYIILLANATNKDIWINIPVNATGSSDPLDPAYVASPDTSSYIYNLAYLLKNGDAFTGNVGLNSNLHIYIEDSNEVWNSSSAEDWWNAAAANAEGCNSGSVLCNDGDNNSNDWAARRHIKRMYEIGDIFQGVFGSGSLNNKIRMVYAWWQLDEGTGSGAANALSWFNKTYGAPSNYIYSMAQADYFFNANYANDTTIDEVLQDLQSGSEGETDQIQYVQDAYTTAQQYGLKLVTYEGGPDTDNNGTQSTTNVGVAIEANRQYAANDDIGLGMDLLLENQLRDQWFPYGGYTFGIFQLSGAYSRYGDYGLTDDLCNLQTAKYSAVLNLTGYSPGVPSAPSPSATAGNQTVTLNWPSVTSAANYTVERSTTSGGPYSTLGTACTPTYWDTAVTNGTTYYYVVAAVNAVGEQTVSSQISATPSGSLQPPGAPTSLTASAGNGQVQLSWNAPTTGGAVSTYQVWDSSGGGYSEANSAVTSTTYTVTGLTNGTQYSFYVTASNSAGTSGDSNTATATPNSAPAAPTGLTAMAGNGQVSLTWNASSGATSYNVYDGTSSGGESGTPIATGISSTAYTVTGLSNGTTYYFKVAAVNSSGQSGYSNEASATPSSGGGGTLLAYEPFGETSGSTIALNNASGGGDSGWAEAWVVQNSDTEIPGYNIVDTTPLTYSGLQTASNYAIGGYQYVSSGRQLNVSSGGPFNSYLSGGLIGASGQTLWLSFLMRADQNNGQTEAVILNNNSGTNAWLSGSSNDIGIGYLGGSAYWGLMYNNGTPVLSNVPVTQGQTTLLVAEITFGSTNTINLFVNPTSLGGSAPSSPSATISTSGSIAFESLAYYAGNGTNESSLGDIRFGSSYAAVTPTTAGPPSAPTGLTASAGNGQVSLSWNSSSGATSYNVYEGTSSGGESGTPIATGITSAAYTVTSLNNGTTYYFKVAAVNSSGTSGYSNEASATPEPPAPSAPTGLTASAGNGQVSLSWNSSSGATSYNVYDGTSSGGESGTPIATGITSTSYTVTSLTNGTTYYFKVKAVNGGGQSGYSNEASATPASGGGGTLLAYEPFGETSGSTIALNGASGGGDSGWGAAWVVQNGDSEIPGYNIVDTSPLTYSGLTTTGTYAIGGYNYVSAGRQLNVNSSGPFSSYLSNGLIGASGQTLWLSFLIRVDNSNGQTNAIILNYNSSGNAWLTNSSNDIGIGDLIGYGGSAYWGLMYNNGTPVLSSVPVTQGQTTLLVASITFGSTNVIDLYVNPTSLGGSAPSSPSATISTTGSVAFQSLAYQGGYQTNDGSLADIRVGTTYAAVTP